MRLFASAILSACGVGADIDAVSRLPHQLDILSTGYSVFAEWFGIVDRSFGFILLCLPMVSRCLHQQYQ
ncbi:hypothetical protein [Undibacterium sp. Tian12W]|uniref:hypothetical protein n=1 Tax=Undibacterium sp. Tian12W TaxID=3413054 RepID=UPI003BF4E05E